MTKKPKFWILLFTAVLAVCLGAYALQDGVRTGRPVAYIYRNTELAETIDLLAVAVPYEITFTCDKGDNTVLVEHGRISITAADCPDKLCVRQGAIPNGEMPIVCLPHKLVIQIGEP